MAERQGRLLALYIVAFIVLGVVAAAMGAGVFRQVLGGAIFGGLIGGVAFGFHKYKIKDRVEWISGVSFFLLLLVTGWSADITKSDDPPAAWKPSLPPPPSPAPPRRPDFMPVGKLPIYTPTPTPTPTPAPESDAPEAVTGWTMCNKSDERVVSVAYSYKDSLGWVRKGWRNIERGDCTVLISEITTRSVYYYAEGGDRVWSGDKKFCAHPSDAFTFREGSACTGKYKLYPYKEVDAGGSLNWTTTLVE